VRQRRWSDFARLVLAAVVVALASNGASWAEAKTHLEGRRIPAMVARVLPAVVSITTRQIEPADFNQTKVVRGLGSGFIVDPRGFILTNTHVVDGAEQIKVALPDDRVFTARLVGSDRLTDLAVLKIEGDDFPTVPLGDSSRLAVGETVVAIGNPMWLEGGPTVTLGIVSALGRSMEQDGLPMLHDLVQTDAAINQGNSGGPLLDLDGRVVGINTAIVPIAHGIGFAISTNMAKPIVRALIERGRIVRPSLGLEAVSVTPQIAHANELPVARGALVVRVDDGGPAQAAGLAAGDVITAVETHRVRDLHELHELVFRRRAGETVRLTLVRHGRLLTVTTELRDEP
jgi:S1-C subfamily serine protease